MRNAELQRSVKSVNKLYNQWKNDQSARNLNALLKVIQEWVDNYCASKLNHWAPAYLHGEMTSYIINHVSSKLPEIELTEGREFFPYLFIIVRNRANGFFSSREYRALQRERKHLNIESYFFASDDEEFLRIDETIPDDIDMEQDLLAAEQVELVLQTLRRACVKVIDHSIVDGLEAGRYTGRELAEYTDCSRTYVNNRLKYLRSALDDPQLDCFD